MFHAEKEAQKRRNQKVNNLRRPEEEKIAHRYRRDDEIPL